MKRMSKGDAPGELSSRTGLVHYLLVQPITLCGRCFLPMRLQHGHPPGHWLPILKKAYTVVDRASINGIKHMALTRPDTIACRAGCAHCCRGVIPVSAPELAGAFWYVAEHCSGSERYRVEPRLLQRPFGECPFLIDEKCVIYPVRFFACRQFFMFGQACTANEDVWKTRRNDIPRPDHQEKLKAFALLAGLYGVEPQRTIRAKFLERFIRDVSAPLHLWDLSHPRVIVADLEERRLNFGQND